MTTSDFFRARLDQMIDLRHPLAVLATRLPWASIEAAVAPKLAAQAKPAKRLKGEDLAGAFDGEFGGGVSPAGRPRLPVRLMASLLYLKNSFNLSDEEVVQRWAENVQWQFFSGRDYYEPRLPCDATQIGRFRRLLGEDGLEQLLKATIECAVQIKAVKPAELERVIVDTTVQSKAIAHPVDSRLLEIARHKVVGAAKRAGIALKQTYAQEGKTLRRKAGGYAHAKQFKRLRKAVKRQRTKSRPDTNEPAQAEPGDGPQQPADVVARRAAQRMQRIAHGALQPASVHAVVGLGVPDQRLDRLAPLEKLLFLVAQSIGCDSSPVVDTLCRRNRYSNALDSGVSRSSKATAVLPPGPSKSAGLGTGHWRKPHYWSQIHRHRMPARACNKPPAAR